MSWRGGRNQWDSRRGFRRGGGRGRTNRANTNTKNEAIFEKLIGSPHSRTTMSASTLPPETTHFVSENVDGQRMLCALARNGKHRDVFLISHDPSSCLLKRKGSIKFPSCEIFFDGHLVQTSLGTTFVISDVTVHDQEAQNTSAFKHHKMGEKGFLAYYGVEYHLTNARQRSELIREKLFSDGMCFFSYHLYQERADWVDEPVNGPIYLFAKRYLDISMSRFVLDQSHYLWPTGGLIFSPMDNSCPALMWKPQDKYSVVLFVEGDILFCWDPISSVHKPLEGLPNVVQIVPCQTTKDVWCSLADWFWCFDTQTWIFQKWRPDKGKANTQNTVEQVLLDLQSWSSSVLDEVNAQPDTIGEFSKSQSSNFIESVKNLIYGCRTNPKSGTLLHLDSAGCVDWKHWKKTGFKSVLAVEKDVHLLDVSRSKQKLDACFGAWRTLSQPNKKESHAIKSGKNQYLARPSRAQSLHVSLIQAHEANPTHGDKIDMIVSSMVSPYVLEGDLSHLFNHLKIGRSMFFISLLPNRYFFQKEKAEASLLFEEQFVAEKKANQKALISNLRAYGMSCIGFIPYASFQCILGYNHLLEETKFYECGVFRKVKQTSSPLVYGIIRNGTPEMLQKLLSHDPLCLSSRSNSCTLSVLQLAIWHCKTEMVEYILQHIEDGKILHHILAKLKCTLNGNVINVITDFLYGSPFDDELVCCLLFLPWVVSSQLFQKNQMLLEVFISREKNFVFADEDDSSQNCQSTKRDNISILSAPLHTRIEMIKLLLKFRAAVSWRLFVCGQNFDGDQKKLLHLLVMKAPSEVVRVLLQYNPLFLNSVDEKGRTPLFYAGYDNIPIMIAQGANVHHVDYQGQTALFSHPESYALIAAGVEINLQDNNGCTALMLACMHGTASVLISSGANPDILDNEGRKAEDYTHISPWEFDSDGNSINYDSDIDFAGSDSDFMYVSYGHQMFDVPGFSDDGSEEWDGYPIF